MKALVTGATGFIGSHLVDRLLERDDAVRALVRPSSDVSYLEERGVELVRGDITDPASLPAALAGIDVVYHAAAQVGDWGPWRDFEAVTIDGTRNVLEATARAGVPRFLHVSTDGVYAHRYLGKRMTEETPLETRFAWWDYYRRSKLAAERLAWRYHEDGRLAMSAVRPGLVLGERDRATLPGMVAFLRSGSAMYFGDGHNRLPCGYAGDVADACLLAAAEEGAAGQAYNAGSQETVTQRDLFAAIAEESDLALPKRSLPLPIGHGLALAMETISVLRGRRTRPSLTRMAVTLIAGDYLEDAGKAERELGWRAQTPMREAVRRAVEWQRAAQPQAASG
ncbi:MAG: NAD-dependent epimerase/dehydratase family protein [Dehalococcoidia bacterium]|nr:MAG: NAD-dependent epimerase/dehydratase family protein [Dehalococcoidia bacterium]